MPPRPSYSRLEAPGNSSDDDEDEWRVVDSRDSSASAPSGAAAEVEEEPAEEPAEELLLELENENEEPENENEENENEELEHETSSSSSEAAASSSPPPTATTERFSVQVEEGMAAGSEVRFVTPRGDEVVAAVPPGLSPGDSFLVEVPIADAAGDDAPTLLELLESGRTADAVLAELEARNPSPDSSSFIVLDFLREGAEPSELAAELRLAEHADAPAARRRLAAEAGGADGGDVELTDLVGSSSPTSRRPFSSLEPFDVEDGQTRFPRSHSGSVTVSLGPLRQRSERAARGCAELVRGRGAHLAGAVLATVVAVLVFVLSTDRLPPFTYGLDYDALTRTIGGEAATVSGLHWLGLFHSFIFVPATVQTLAWGSLPDDPPPLYARSSDGLKLEIAMSVQWRYDPARLADAYVSLPRGASERLEMPGGTADVVLPGRAVVHNAALATILYECTRHSLHDFLTDKARVSAALEDAVRAAVAPFAADVLSLQLADAEPPTAMRDALMLSATTKLDVLRAEKYREAMRVVFATMEIAATFHRNVTVTKSHGVAKAVGELARGRAAITARTVAAEVLALRNVSARGRLSPDEVCEYFGYDRFIGARNVTRKGVIVRGIGGLIASPPPPAGQWFG